MNALLVGLPAISPTEPDLGRQLHLFDEAAMPAIQRRCRQPARDRSRRHTGLLHRVPCTIEFREAVLTLAAERKIEPSDLAQSMLALVDNELRRQIPDPGVAASGEDDGSSLLEIRLNGRHAAATVRQALAVALVMADPGRRVNSIAPEIARLTREIDALRIELGSALAALDKLAFTPLAEGVRNRREASYVLGLPNRQDMDLATINNRFRQLAPVFHPDVGVLASTERMMQLIAARDILRKHALDQG